MAEKTRYSDAELEEFRAIIMEKLELAQRDYEQLKKSLMGLDGNDTDDTSPTPSDYLLSIWDHRQLQPD